jgi:hypothetical protein
LDWAVKGLDSCTFWVEMGFVKELAPPSGLDWLPPIDREESLAFGVIKLLPRLVPLSLSEMLCCCWATPERRLDIFC